MPTIDATLPETIVAAGEEWTIQLSPLFNSGTVKFNVAGHTLPTDLAPKPNAWSCTSIAGTPATPGEYTVPLIGTNAYGEETGQNDTLTVIVQGPTEVIPAPAAEGTEDGYMLPEVPGVRWLVNGEETPPGTYSVQPVTEETTVTILPEALAGYEFDAAPEPLVLTFTPAPDPDPDPEPDPEDPEDPGEWLHLLDEDPERALVASTLAPRALRHAGMDPDAAPAPAAAMAEGHLATVLEYVKGYTRGRGFHGYVPERPLQAVIVAATGRLVTNPEQVTYYSTGDYSERPATLTGWTLAELQVLRRYRRVTA